MFADVFTFNYTALNAQQSFSFSVQDGLLTDSSTLPGLSFPGEGYPADGSSVVFTVGNPSTITTNDPTGLQALYVTVLPYTIANAVPVDPGDPNTLYTIDFVPNAYGGSNGFVEVDNSFPITITNVSLVITQTSTPGPVAVTPEPSTFVLIGTGLIGAGAVQQRRLRAV